MNDSEKNETQLTTMSKVTNQQQPDLVSFQDPASEDVILHTNKGYFIPFMITLLLGAMHVGFSMSSANQLTPLFNAKYGWAPDSSEATQGNAIIGASVVVGLTCGALSAGKFITMGRRKTQLIFNCIGMFGVAMCMV